MGLVEFRESVKTVLPVIGYSAASLAAIALVVILIVSGDFRAMKKFLWDRGLKKVFRFIFPSRVIPWNCDNCLQRNGEGWSCDCEPREFEPEARLVRSKEGGFEPDFTAVPNRKSVYCKEFIPTRPYWRYLKFKKGKWIKPIGLKSE